MKFLIIGCYALADGYKAMSNGLRYLGHDIAFFPLFASQDILRDGKHKNYKIEDEILSAIKGERLSVDMGLYINNCSEKCGSVIMWHGVDLCAKYNDTLKKIKSQTGIKLVQINWDPNPHFKKYLDSYYANYDHIFSVNSKITKYLRDTKKFKNAYHFHQGFDEDYSFYKKDEDFKCDVSMVCTNLYTNGMWKDKNLDRKKILDLLYADDSIDLRVYGPEFLGKKYPKAYKGYIPYSQAYLVFSNSLVNLNISSVGDSLTTKLDGKDFYYFSERLPQILACKGLMVCDQEFGTLLKKDKDYIKLEKEEDIIKIVNDVKAKTRKYNTVRKSGYTTVLKSLNCQKFGEQIMGRMG